MKKTLLSLSIASAALCVATSAVATPILNKDDAYQVTIPASGYPSTWYYGANSTDLYVTPPSTGSVTLQSFIPQNASYCGTLEEVRAIESDTASTYFLMLNQLNRLEEQYGLYEYEKDENGQLVKIDGRLVPKLDSDGNPILTEFGQDIEDAASEKSEKRDAMDAAELEQTKLKRIYDEAKREKDDLRDDLDDCKEEAEDDDEEWRDYCEDEYDDYRDARSDERDAKSDYRDAEYAFLDAEYEYNRAKRAYDELDATYIENNQRLSTMSVNLRAQLQALSALYKDVAAIYGGQVNVAYQTNWGDLIQEFQAANPDKNIRRVDIKNSKVYIPQSASYQDNPGLVNLPSTIWSSISIANEEQNVFTELPDGTTHVAQEDRLLGWADTFTGSVGLFLPNTCRMIDGTEGLSGAALKTHYSQNFNEYLQASLSYDYDVRADFGYKAEYNLAEIAEVIEKTTKRTGFFNSTSSHELTKNFEDTSAFKMEFYADARTENLTEEEKLDLTSVVRDRLVKNVLDSVARRELQVVPEVSLLETDETASSVLSKELRKRCTLGWGWRCYGGWALYAINGIWGNRSEAISTYKATFNSVQTEDVTTNFFVEYGGSISFLED